MNNEIVLNEDEIDGITTSLSSSFESVSSTGEAINPNFSGAVSVGLLGNSIGIISDQMSSISTTINNTQSLIDEYKNQLLSYDSKMASKIDDIQMPRDLIANNSSKVNMFTQSLLSKMDGKSVNEGSTVSGTYDTLDSTIVSKGLSDITSGSISTQEYDATSSIEKENSLNNITNSSTTEIEPYDDDISIEETFMLVDMIPRGIMDEVTYDDSSIVEKKELSDISNNYVEDFDVNKILDEELDNYMNKVTDEEIDFYMNKYANDEIDYYMKKLGENE